MKLQASFIKIFLLIFSFLFINASINAETIYVSELANGADNGNSWNDAFNHLQDALDVANSGDEIWVAAGKYMLTDVSESFVLKDGVKIYGGFIGTETNLSDRDFQQNLSILTGDVEQNDIAGDFQSNRTDNSLHVVFVPEDISNATVVDGLVISSGNTTGQFGSDNDKIGGGILVFGAPIIKNCLMTNNFAYNGGGICLKSANSVDAEISNCRLILNAVSNRGAGIYYADPDLEYEIDACYFEGNMAADGGAGIASLAADVNVSNSEFVENSTEGLGGGAIFVNGFISEPKLNIIDCIFDANQATTNGGAVFMSGNKSKCNSTNSIFKNNVSDGTGGAIYVIDGKINTQNDQFENNSASLGGAISAVGDSLIIEGGMFMANSATELGGAVYASESVIVLVNSTKVDGNIADNGAGFYLENVLATISSSEFKNNEANLDGGAIYANSFETLIINCIFNKNKAEFGGGIVCNEGNSLLIINSTFVKNIALSEGSSTITNVNSNTIIVNSIFWGNKSAGDNDIFDFDFNEQTFPVTNHCLIENGIAFGQNIISSNPDFVDFENDDFHLLPSSPAVDAGTYDFSNVPNVDFDGEQRGETPDIGAYEYPFDFPATPSGLNASMNSNSSILINWIDNSDNETGFVLERSIGNDSNWTLLNDEITANETSFEDLGLPNSIYYYRIRSVRESIYSEYSNIDSAQINVLTPAAPTELDTILVADVELTLTWNDNSTNEESFILQRGVSENGLADFATIPPGTSTYTDDGLSPNTTYFYAIKARNNEGDSDLSNVLSVTTKVGTGLNVLEVDLNIYPNPVTDFVSIDLSTVNELFEEVSIYSIEGKLIKTIKIATGNKNIKFDLSDLATANYYLFLSNDENVVVKQFMKR